MKLARALVATSYGLLALILWLHPDHMVDPDWSLHAEIHLRQGINWAMGLCAMGLLVTFFALRIEECWAWWALLLNATILFAGYSAPPLILAIGPFSPVDVWGIGILAALNLLGLSIARRHLYRQ